MDAVMEKKQTVQHHTDCAHHLEMAAKHYHEAAKHHESGNHEKGRQAAMVAHGHACCAMHHADKAAMCSAGIDAKQCN